MSGPIVGVSVFLLVIAVARIGAEVVGWTRDARRFRADMAAIHARLDASRAARHNPEETP